MRTLDEVLADMPRDRQAIIARRANKIAAGLNDAIARTKGDESAARIVRPFIPEPENAEDLAAAKAKAKAMSDAHEEQGSGYDPGAVGYELQGRSPKP